MKLTEKMRLALSGLNEGPNSAYGLRVSLSTLDALLKRKLVKPEAGPGWSYSPQTCRWTITQVGKDALAITTLAPLPTAPDGRGKPL